jgi:hypothetical protein
MKKSITSILALLALCAAPAMAVPSGINYQGALTDDQGNPITGTRTMSIKLYDAATAGTLLYSESIGTVDVSDGVFSFEFGTSGTSNAEQSDTVAITDGTATTFQKVLSAAQVVAGTVTVTDGTYTWSQSGGSSNEENFSVVYSTNLRRVTVTYLNGAPAAGRTITATYRTPASGISGALAGDNQPWAEITVDGVAQVPRQKVLTVPFAHRAISAASVDVVVAQKSQSVGVLHPLASTRASHFPIQVPLRIVPTIHGETYLTGDFYPTYESGQIFLPTPSRLIGFKARVFDTATRRTVSHASLGAYTGGNMVIELWCRRGTQPATLLARLDSEEAFNTGFRDLGISFSFELTGDEILWARVYAPFSAGSLSGTSLPSGGSLWDGELRTDHISLEFEHASLQ